MQARHFKIIGKYRKGSKLDINLEACWGEVSTIKALKIFLEHYGKSYPEMQFWGVPVYGKSYPEMQFWGVPVYDNHKQKEKKVDKVEKFKEKVFQEALKLEQCAVCYEGSCNFNNAVKYYQNAIKPKVPHKAAVYAWHKWGMHKAYNYDVICSFWEELDWNKKQETYNTLDLIKAAPE